MEGLKSLLKEHERLEGDDGSLAGDPEFIKAYSSAFVSPKAKEMRD
jgi:hypothetical protein